LVDSRLDPQKIDLEFILWCAEQEVPFALIFTKADKQSHSKTMGTVDKFLAEMATLFGDIPDYFITSAETSEGKVDVVNFIEENVAEFYGK
jgi:GTP-binding protein